MNKRCDNNTNFVTQIITMGGEENTACFSAVL